MELQTEHLILRELVDSDWRAVHEYDVDLEVVKYMPFGPNTEQDSKNFVQRNVDAQKEQPRTKYQMALTTKEDDRLVGCCALTLGSREKKEGTMGWILNRRYWNRGYMTEAAAAVLAFGFRELGLHRITAVCHPSNIASSRVMEKIGMRYEGYLREELFVRGQWLDSLLYAILEKEWQDRQNHTLPVKPARETAIEYLELSQEHLDVIRPLWKKLFDHHRYVSRYFKENRSGIDFTLRKEQLLEKSRDGALRLDIAKDSNNGKYIGYCVTSLSRVKQGEIDSIYVEKEYRNSGIGDRLMKRALGWLEAMSAKRKILGVGKGNEGVFAFYRRYNFYPRTTILEQKQEK